MAPHEACVRGTEGTRALNVQDIFIKKKDNIPKKLLELSYHVNFVLVTAPAGIHREVILPRYRGKASKRPVLTRRPCLPQAISDAGREVNARCLIRARDRRTILVK
jgi:hypothetical protein